MYVKLNKTYSRKNLTWSNNKFHNGVYFKFFNKKGEKTVRNEEITKNLI